MSEERKRILDMLAAGKLTSEEAERLLDKLSGAAEGGPPDASGAPRAKRAGIPSYLRVVVDSTDGDKVNIRVPLALVRTGIKLTTMLPSEASQKIKDSGIDLGLLSELQGDELLKALEELTVEVDSADGDTVRVFCE